MLSILAERLGHVGAELSSGRRPDAGWTLSTGHEIHRRLGALTRARSTARINVRVAPRRWRRRRAVDAENLRTAQLDLLANAVISLIRSVTRPDEAQAPPDPALVSEITVMAGALRWLAEAERPWSETILRETETVARDALTRAGARGIDRAEVSAAILRAVAGDLIAVLAPPPEPPMSEQ